MTWQTPPPAPVFEFERRPPMVLNLYGWLVEALSSEAIPADEYGVRSLGVLTPETLASYLAVVLVDRFEHHELGGITIQTRTGADDV